MAKTKNMVTSTYEELDYTNFFIFGKVNQNPDISVPTLEMILGTKIDRNSILGSANVEKVLKETEKSKGIRLDIYLMTKEQIYNAEMENYSSDKKKEVRKRSRYYQGLIDMDHLSSGNPYYNLKETYIIFICTYDVFGKGYYRYQFENICKHDTDLKLNDGTVKLFLNSKGYRNAPGDEISQDLKNYLKYVDTGNAVDDLTRRIDMEVINVQNNKVFKVEYMREMADRMDYEHTIELRDQAIADKDAALADKDAALADKDAALADKDAALADKDAALANKDAALADKDAEIAELKRQLSMMAK